MKVSLFAASLLTLLLPIASQAVEITLDRPGDREFLRDQAHLLSEADSQEIRKRCDKLLTDKATPIIVITIDRMANHGGEGMRIETFARLLFDQWEIGHAQLNGQTWNTGILLLVSSKDRKAASSSATAGAGTKTPCAIGLCRTRLFRGSNSRTSQAASGRE